MTYSPTGGQSFLRQRSHNQGINIYFLHFTKGKVAHSNAPKPVGFYFQYMGCCTIPPSGKLQCELIMLICASRSAGFRTPAALLAHPPLKLKRIIEIFPAFRNTFSPHALFTNVVPSFALKGSYLHLYSNTKIKILSQK